MQCAGSYRCLYGAEAESKEKEEMVGDKKSANLIERRRLRPKMEIRENSDMDPPYPVSFYEKIQQKIQRNLGM